MGKNGKAAFRRVKPRSPLRHKLAQITSTVGSATRESVRRKAA
jgi:hypothetical protein